LFSENQRRLFVDGNQNIIFFQFLLYAIVVI